MHSYIYLPPSRKHKNATVDSIGKTIARRSSNGNALPNREGEKKDQLKPKWGKMKRGKTSRAH